MYALLCIVGGYQADKGWTWWRDHNNVHVL